MNLVSAKCPNCGANIEVSPEMETTKCKSCGSAILVDDAIQKYKIEVSGEVSLSGISSLENDLELGKQCLAAQDWETAYKVYSGAIDKKSVCFEAWSGCLSALTQNFTWADKSWVPIEGIKGLKSVIANCLMYATTEQKNETTSKLECFMGSHNRVVSSEIELNRHRKKRACSTGPRVSLIMIVLGIIILALAAGGGIGIIGIALILFSLFTLFVCLFVGISVDNSQEVYLEKLRNITQSYVK